MNDRSDQLAIALVSGGMDSLVTAALANNNHKELAFLHLNYGQKTEKKELECFHNIADFYNVPRKLRKVIDVSYFRQIGGSSLTDDTMEVKNYQGESDQIPDSYVPFRNSHIIAMAVSWAEIIGAKKIYIGAVHEDSSGYPDCRPSYYKAMNKLIQEGTKCGDIEVVTPIIHMEKPKIIQTGLDLQAPIHWSWSCYARGDKACGVCDSCALRLRAFQRLGMKDPIEYVTRPNYLK